MKRLPGWLLKGSVHTNLVVSKMSGFVSTCGLSLLLAGPSIFMTLKRSLNMSSFIIMSTQGQRFGWNRSGCDNTFKQDMYRLCEKQFSRLISWPTKYERCKFFADLYYKAVRTAGSLYWSNPSEGWCKNVCTEALGDPSKPLDV